MKLVWFVPREALDATREAVFAAGAGCIGDYEHCSWYTDGTGTFLGREGTDPEKLRTTLGGILEERVPVWRQLGILE